ncbi:MAG: DUF433 domain-containing protein [Anaerolineae bacterium]|jgi:uncharacterized protein (DUF433 family)|nr:DUF433 domain-containing protein [Anaerolineae bacterium]
MVSLAELEAIIAGLDDLEKIQVIRWIMRDLADSHPGIEHLPTDQGNEAAIVRTGIPVWSLVQMQRMGVDDTDILRMHPMLRAEDLVNAWAYAQLHREEIEQQIRRHQE